MTTKSEPKGVTWTGVLVVLGSFFTLNLSLSIWGVQSNYTDLRDARHWTQAKVEELRTLTLKSTSESRTIARDQYNQLREDMGRGRDDLSALSARIAALESQVVLAIQASADRDALLAEQDAISAQAHQRELARLWEVMHSHDRSWHATRGKPK